MTVTDLYCFSDCNIKMRRSCSSNRISQVGRGRRSNFFFGGGGQNPILAHFSCEPYSLPCTEADWGKVHGGKLQLEESPCALPQLVALLFTQAILGTVVFYPRTKGNSWRHSQGPSTKEKTFSPNLTNLCSYIKISCPECWLLLSKPFLQVS